MPSLSLIPEAKHQSVLVYSFNSSSETSLPPQTGHGSPNSTRPNSTQSGKTRRQADHEEEAPKAGAGHAGSSGHAGVTSTVLGACCFGDPNESGNR